MNWIKKLMSYWGNSQELPSKSHLSEETLKWPSIKRKNTFFSTGYWRIMEHTKIMKSDDIPVREARWIFKVITGIDKGREYVAISKEIRVGRHPENLILLRDPKASRFHAIIYRKGSRLVLEDLGSTNGTRINGEMVSKKRAVLSGDLIRIGETIIQVSLEKG